MSQNPAETPFDNIESSHQYVALLAQAIEEVVTGEVDYSTLSRGARARHAEFFSDTAMAAGVASVYREVLAQTKV